MRLEELRRYRWFRDPVVYFTLGCLGYLTWIDPLAGLLVVVGACGAEGLLRRFTKKG